MNMPEPDHPDDHRPDEIPTGPLPTVAETPAAPPRSAVLEQIGGSMGPVYAAIPVMVVGAANTSLPLPATVGVSIGTGAVLTVVRIVRGERITSAGGSLVGVAVAAGIVAVTGDAKDFFAIGIWLSLAGFLITSGSVLARHPISGVVWNALHGGAHAWRADRAVRLAHDVATSAAALVLGARFVIQQWLYLADATAGLGIARVAMGTPLTVLAALVVVWAFHRSSQRILRPA